MICSKIAYFYLIYAKFCIHIQRMIMIILYVFFKRFFPENRHTGHLIFAIKRPIWNAIKCSVRHYVLLYKKVALFSPALPYPNVCFYSQFILPRPPHCHIRTCEFIRNLFSPLPHPQSHITTCELFVYSKLFLK